MPETDPALLSAEEMLAAYASGRLQRSYETVRASGHCSRIERALGRLAG